MNKKIVFLGLGTLLFLLALAGGYYGYGYFLKKSEDSNVSQLQYLSNDQLTGTFHCQSAKVDGGCDFTFRSDGGEIYFISGEEKLLTEMYKLDEDQRIAISGTVSGTDSDGGVNFKVISYEKI